MLNEVLYIPSFKYNLLSVPKLTKDNNCIVIFYPTLCIIQDLDTKKILGIGRRNQGLYFLQDNSLHGVDDKMQDLMVQLTEICHSKNIRVRSADSNQKQRSEVFELWHKKLGHAPYNRLKHIPQLEVTSSTNKVCVTCPMAKFVKLPYQLSQNRRKNICELIHLDIWGPYRVPTYKNFQYFMTIVDDCSRATWVYLLRHKSQALSTLQQFMNFVSTQFNAKIKVLRSDNALEFQSEPCKQFFNTHGVIHQTSCVDRPQQNGRVERKHRHILEMARALRFQANLPIHL